MSHICPVLDENVLKDVVERYGRENCYFGKLWEGFNFTGDE